MNISITQSNHLKSIAILMMLCIHLFNNLNYQGLFNPLIFWGEHPLIYYISLFCDAAVPVFAFVSGYGLYFKYKKNPEVYGLRSNLKRIIALYKNYWVIFILFVAILGGLLNAEMYLGSFSKFFLAFTGLTASSYNGAAWFFTIYILFLITSKPIFKLVDFAPKIIFLLSGCLYVLGYFLRMYHAELFSNPILNWLYFNTALFFATTFQILLGVYALKFNWRAAFSKLFHYFPNFFTKNIIAILGILGLIVLHGYLPNAIMAPITGFGFIMLFLHMQLPEIVERALNSLTPHATNIWLTHMFFQITYFKEFIYSPQYIIPIFLLLLACCILSSYLINFILSFDYKLVFNKNKQAITK